MKVTVTESSVDEIGIVTVVVTDLVTTFPSGRVYVSGTVMTVTVSWLSPYLAY